MHSCHDSASSYVAIIPHFKDFDMPMNGVKSRGPSEPHREKTANVFFALAAALIVLGIGYWGVNQLSPRTPPQILNTVEAQ
jgi:hypothetical protein